MQALCDVTDWYQGGVTPNSPILVYDEQDRFPFAVRGCRGKAIYDEHDRKYHMVECQQFSTILRARVKFVMDNDTLLFFDTEYFERLTPHDGYPPWINPHGYSPSKSGADIIGTRVPAVGEDVVIHWRVGDRTSNGRWEYIDHDTPVDRDERTNMKWAKCQQDWQEPGEEDDHGKPWVLCKNSDIDGLETSSDTFVVLLPRTTDCDPSVYAGEVIGYIFDLDGNIVCITDYLWSHIGDVQIKNRIDRVPTGWRHCDESSDVTADMRDRVPVGWNPDGDLILTPSGEETHTHEEHEAHTHGPGSTQRTFDSLDGINLSLGAPDEGKVIDFPSGDTMTYLTAECWDAFANGGISAPDGPYEHDEKSNRQLGRVLAFIERYK